MDGIHDLGGKPGYGFVDQTSKAHPFEAPWEGRVFAMLNLVAKAGAYRNADEFRHAIERIAEDHYFCLLYTSPSPRDRTRSRMPSSA